VSRFRAGVFCLGFAVSAMCARADLPAVRFDQLVPLGGARGSEFEVEVKGADLEGVDRLLFDHPGLSATPVEGKERFFKVVVNSDVPTGTREVYLAGRFGVSNPRLLAITTGLVEVADNQQNRTRDTAQLVDVNSAVNGTVDGNAEDFYQFVGRAGQTLRIDCQAQRLASELDGVLNLSRGDGALVASSSDVYGRDPCIDITLPADGEYVVDLHDLSYRGGYPYRIVLSDQPQVDSVFPTVVQAGVETSLTAVGRNLAALGGVRGALVDDGQPLEELVWRMTADPALVDRGEYLFRDHPTHHSVLPTAATCTVVGRQAEIPGVESVWSFPPVVVTGDPVTAEVEGNDTREAAQAVALPLMLAGRFDQPQDADWFAFQPPESGNYLFNVYCERIAGRADPYVVITDDKGNPVSDFDDYGHRTNAFDGHLRDPSQEVSLNKDLSYRVLVQDRYLRGGPRYRYALEIRREVADFFPAVIHSSNQNPAGTTVYKGTAAYLDVVIHHRGNTRCNVTVTAENLPPGLHVAPTTITSDMRGPLVLWADADAPEYTGPLQLIATAEIDGQQIRRAVRSYCRVWNNSGTSLAMRSPMVAIREQGPFDLRIEPAEIEVEQGQPANLTLHLTRHWSDFTDKVTIQPLNFTGGFNLGNFDIASGQTSAAMAIQVPEGTRPGRYTLTVLGQGQVPFNKDATATERPNTLVATPSRPVTITVKEKPKP
jgi:hypothetical protein